MELAKILKEVSLKSNAQFSLRKVTKKTLNISVQNEQILNVTRSLDEGIMIEVFYNGVFGYSSTNDLSLAGVQRASEHALKLAHYSSQHPLFVFEIEHRPIINEKYNSDFQLGFDSISAIEASSILIELCKKMKVNEKIINREIGFFIYETTTEIVSTRGSDAKQIIIRANIPMNVVASNGAIIQQRSWGGCSTIQQGAEILYQKDISNIAQQLAEEALELLSAEDCPIGEMDLLLAPDQMYLQIHESVGHPLELDRILGDERNFAGWSFVQKEDFGKLCYGSNLMNITFDPTVKKQNASYAFDDMGQKATREYLIKDGILQRGLGGIDSQARTGFAGVACQRATSWNRPPIDRMANLNLEPGDSELEDMIDSVKYGVFMKSNRSWSIDDYRLKFQFGCEYGKLIENGKLTKTVKNPNYRGITPKFWNSLKMVGNQKTFQILGTDNCGKGEPNQIIFVGHASPHCLFSNIEVFGGGK